MWDKIPDKLPGALLQLQNIEQYLNAAMSAVDIQIHKYLKRKILQSILIIE